MTRKSTKKIEMQNAKSRCNGNKRSKSLLDIKFLVYGVLLKCKSQYHFLKARLKAIIWTI